MGTRVGPGSALGDHFHGLWLGTCPGGHQMPPTWLEQTRTVRPYFGAALNVAELQPRGERRIP